MPALEFFFDVASPYSYLAATRVEAIAADCKAPLRWCPILLGGVFKATGNHAPAIVPSKAHHLKVDLQRWANWYRIPLQFPDSFPIHSLTVMRMLHTLQEDAQIAASHRLFHAHWGQGLDISDPEILKTTLGVQDLTAAAQQPTKDSLRALTDEAVQRGAFGAPTVFLGDKMFFGNDRLPFVEQSLRAS
jgi:2-hydroxychromene-2-carboxylate isomerase